MNETECIRIKKQTKEELNKRKIIPRETYDEVINRLMKIKK